MKTNLSMKIRAHFLTFTEKKKKNGKNLANEKKPLVTLLMILFD